MVSLLAGLAGCGLFDGGSEEPVTYIDPEAGLDTASGGDDASDTGSIPIIDVPPADDGGLDLLAPDASPACGPVAPKTKGYYPVPGDVDKRRDCETVCQNVCMTCDGQYESSLGTGIAYEAEFGPDGTLTNDGGTCDQRPAAEQTDPASQSTFQLSRYFCFCRP